VATQKKEVITYAMPHHEHSRTVASTVGLIIGHASDTVERLAALIVGVLAVCANSWAAAGVYEELSGLSDAELERRGVPRDGLNRYVFGIVTKRT
jgi:uncharacterized membrane protein (Fun14 family)